MPAPTAAGLLTKEEVGLLPVRHSKVPPGVLGDAGCKVAKFTVVAGQTLLPVVSTHY